MIGESTLKLLTFEKIQEQQNTDIVDLKIANRSWKSGSIPAEQIAELKGEIQQLRDQPLNLNIHGL